MVALLKYGTGLTNRKAANFSCYRILLPLFFCFGVLFCSGQEDWEHARLLNPNSSGESWKGNNSYNCTYLKAHLSYLCPVAGQSYGNSKYMRSFQRIPKSDGMAVIARNDYVCKTCLSTTYDVEWVDFPNAATKTSVIESKANIDPANKCIVYAYSTGNQTSGYDVYYWVDDGIDDTEQEPYHDDKIKPELVGNAFQLFQIGTDVGKFRSLDLSGWDFSGVTSMKSFISGCTTLTDVKFGTADLRNVTDISQMFGPEAKQPNLSWATFSSLVNSFLVDKDKLTSRNAQAKKHKGKTVTTANSVQYVIGSSGSFDEPSNGSTDMVVRNLDAVQRRRLIEFNFDVLYENNGNVARYVIQYLEGEKDWTTNASEIADILTVEKTAVESDLKTYTPEYTPASPETFGGIKNFRIKIIKNDGTIEYSDPFSLVFDDSILNYPDSYVIKKSVNGGDLVNHLLQVDSNGDITLQMNSNDNITYVVPEGMEIICNNFYVSTSSSDYSYSKFINKGSIQAASDIILSSSKQESITYDCNGVYSAENMTLRGKIPEIKGVFNIEKVFKTESNGQGQDITIGNCAILRAYEGVFQHSGGSMKLYIDGELTVEILIEGNMIHVRSGGLLIVGEMDDPSLKIISYPGSILTLCRNPTTGIDNLGFCAGTVYYNYGDYASQHGWGSSNPEEEGDINEFGRSPHSSDYNTAAGVIGKNPIKADFLLAAFSSYSECIDPVNTHILGIDEDPFLPQDKEIKPLYDLNPCSKEFEGQKVFVRELNGGTWLRLINGQLIYCENDNN